MNTYAYLNAVLDDHPSIVRLVLNPAAYAIASGEVPAGERDIRTRVTLEEAAPDAVPGLCVGYDVNDAIIAQFYC